MPADAAFFNSRAVSRLPVEERKLFQRGSSADGSVRMVTIVETYEQANDRRDRALATAGKPVARITAISKGRDAGLDVQVAQVPREALVAEGHPAMICKSPEAGRLVRLRLFNGSIGTVVCTACVPGWAPPEQPLAVILNVPGYTGRRWHPKLPATWIPLTPQEGTDEDRAFTTRKGIALLSAVAVPGHKMQGATIAEGEPFTHCIIALTDETRFETLCGGFTYVLLSRPAGDEHWALERPVVESRWLAANVAKFHHARRLEDARLQQRDEATRQANEHLQDDVLYVALLRYVDLFGLETCPWLEVDMICPEADADACTAVSRSGRPCACCRAGACSLPAESWGTCTCPVCVRLRTLRASGVAGLVREPAPVTGGVPMPVAPARPPRPVEVDGARERLATLTVLLLKEQLKSNRLPVGGKKGDLVERLARAGLDRPAGGGQGAAQSTDTGVQCGGSAAPARGRGTAVDGGRGRGGARSARARGTGLLDPAIQAQQVTRLEADAIQSGLPLFPAASVTVAELRAWQLSCPGLPQGLRDAMDGVRMQLRMRIADWQRPGIGLPDVSAAERFSAWATSLGFEVQLHQATVAHGQLGHVCGIICGCQIHSMRSEDERRLGSWWRVPLEGSVDPAVIAAANEAHDASWGDAEHIGSGAAAVRWRRAMHGDPCATRLIELQELMRYVGWLDAQSVVAAHDPLRNLAFGALDMGAGAIASDLLDVAHGRTHVPGPRYLALEIGSTGQAHLGGRHWITRVAYQIVPPD